MSNGTTYQRAKGFAWTWLLGCLFAAAWTESPWVRLGYGFAFVLVEALARRNRR